MEQRLTFCLSIYLSIISMLLRAKPPLDIAAHKARMLQKVRDDQCAAAVASFKHYLNTEVEVL